MKVLSCASLEGATVRRSKEALGWKRRLAGGEEELIGTVLDAPAGRGCSRKYSNRALDDVEHLIAGLLNPDLWERE